ncbi:MAG: RNA pseudouridine synthase [Oligoflexia bacterium]|nr:RNA pseudouridine synthase [Oligoflexia bacterium]
MNEKIKIIFQNENFLIVFKPSGILSIPGRFAKEDPRTCLIPSVKNILATNEKIDLYTVHRLDFEAQGIVLLAKNKNAHRMANGWFEKREIKKYYEAITEIKSTNLLKVDLDKIDRVENAVTASSESSTDLSTNWEQWTSFILRGKKRAYEMPEPKGKKAITKANLIGKFVIAEQIYLYWHVMPLTGRSHQLRFEFYKRGMPILGDILYDACISSPLSISLQSRDNIALNAFKLDFKGCPGAITEMGLPAEITSPNLLIDSYLLL